jgi:hypothetical protein
VQIKGSIPTGGSSLRTGFYSGELIMPSRALSCVVRRWIPFSSIFAIVLSLSSGLQAQSLKYTGSTPALNFGSVNLCSPGATTPAPCSETLTLTYSVTDSGTLGTPKVLTYGTAGLDFTLATGSTCTGAVTQGNTCTVKVTFDPLYAGLRNGGVQLVNASGTVKTTTLIYGIGNGPQIAFGPGVPIIAGGDLFYTPSSIAIDGAGDLFVGASFLNDTVQCSCIAEFPAGGGPQTEASTVGGDPSQAALDGAGDLFISAGGDSSGLYKQPSGGGGPQAVIYQGNFVNGTAFAVDGKGDLFLGEDETIDELLAGDSGLIALPFTGIVDPYGYNRPSGFAMDPAGNQFAVDTNPNNPRVIELPAGGGAQVTVPFKGLVSPQGLAVDAAGDIFVTEYSSESPSQVLELPADGSAQYVVPFNVANFNEYVEPYAIAISADGNIFVSTNADYNLLELQRATPPTFGFANTSVGSTSSNPQSVQLVNIGNRTLTGTVALSDTTNFKQAFNQTSFADCSSSISLAPGATCNISVSFTPQSAETFNAALTIADNGKLGTQTVPLTGTGVTAAVQVSPAVLDFGSIPLADTASKALTVTNTGTGTLTVDPSSNGRGAVITGNTCGAGIGAGKSCTLEVEFKPVQLGLNTNTITIQTNGTTNPQVPVRGTATGVGSLTTALDFGTVKGRGKTASQSLYVINVGVPGTVTVATETGATTFHVTTNTCTTGVTAGGNACYIQIEFAPVQTGPETAYLKLIPSTGPEQLIVMTGDLVP